jgi:hypothetical protein
MNAHWKVGNVMMELTVTVRESGKAPNFKKTAAELLQRCREFYQDPENERAYQEWKANRDAKTAKAVSA